MKIAIPYWHERISPVFDVASNLLLVNIVNGDEQQRREVYLEAEAFGVRINTMVELGTNVLICGAISKPLEMGLVARGIKVIPQICGDVAQVLAAYISGQFNQDTYLMPGCCRRRRYGRGGQRWKNRQKGGDSNAQR